VLVWLVRATNPQAAPYVGTDGVSVNTVSAGTCVLSPSGSTMNFVFTDGTSNYIGTAESAPGLGGAGRPGSSLRQPSVCFSADSRRCASASVSSPKHTFWFSSFSV
jgi:hypothetical protein